MDKSSKVEMARSLLAGLLLPGGSPEACVAAAQLLGLSWLCTQGLAALTAPESGALAGWLETEGPDEVPQFWNVLRGEMSLVGPRPERPEFVDDLAVKIPFYRSRHVVKPDITGWAQIKYRHGSSVEDALVKLQYDLYYIKHQSLYLNLLIVLNTIGVVLKMGGT